MLQEMLQQGLAQADLSSSAVDVFSTNMQAKCSADTKAIEKLVLTSVVDTTQSVDAMKVDFDGECANMSSALQTANDLGDKAETSLRDLAASAKTQKRKLDQTVTEVVAACSHTTEEACRVVGATSAVANKTLADVVSATQTMTATTSSSMAEFTSFLDDTGAEFKTDIMSYIDGCHQHINQQSSGLASLDRHINDYGSIALGTVIDVTGRTPKKQRFEELPCLVSTRDHNAIMSEVRTAHLSKPPVTHVHAVCDDDAMVVDNNFGASSREAAASSTKTGGLSSGGADVSEQENINPALGRSGSANPASKKCKDRDSGLSKDSTSSSLKAASSAEQQQQQVLKTRNV